MPKEKETNKAFLTRMVREHPNVLRSDSMVLMCIYCDCTITGNKIYNVKQHFTTAKHLAAENRKKKYKETQMFVSSYEGNQMNGFDLDLCKMLIEANIPFSKVNSTCFSTFLEKYTKKRIPSEMSLRRKYLPFMYNQCIKEMQDKAKNKCIWISIDETSDAEQRLIANFIFGIMDDSENEVEKSYLLNITEVTNANASTMAAFVNDSLLILWPEGIQYQNVLVAVTDAAAYMLAGVNSLSVLYPRMLHLTCFAHGLHRMADYVRVQYSGVNELISSSKAVFLKAPSRKNAFKAACPDISLPPKPCVTRWGTWLAAVDYYSKNFNEVKNVVDSFHEEDAESIKRTKKLLASVEIKNQLSFIKSNFCFINTSIKKLETKGLPLNESIKIMIDVRKNLAKMTENKFLKKFDDIMKRNKGYEQLVRIHDIIFKNENISNELISKLSPSELTFFKFCPTTSVDVERSFSTYKNFLTENRRSFTLENLKKHIIVHCFKSFNEEITVID